jgi:energy-coupling factor transport system substrate-specific component
MTMFTSNVVTFKVKNILVLMCASVLSATGFLWPFFYSSAEIAQTQLIFWGAIGIAVLLVIIEVSNSRLDAKSVALLGILAAIIAALRPLGAGAVGIEPMWFILILSARVFGPSFGFLLGVISMFASALLTGGMGPWLGYQIFAAAWVGMLAGFLPKKVTPKLEILMLALYGVIASMLFGILMDLQFWPWTLGSGTQLSYIPGGMLSENLSRFFTFHFLTAMAWDVPRAIFTATLILVTGRSILSALYRTHTRAAFMAPIEFIQSTTLKSSFEPKITER